MLQQDGARCHSSYASMAEIDEMFPGSVISQRNKHTGRILAAKFRRPFDMRLLFFDEYLKIRPRPITKIVAKMVWFGGAGLMWSS